MNSVWDRVVIWVMLGTLPVTFINMFVHMYAGRNPLTDFCVCVILILVLVKDACDQHESAYRAKINREADRRKRNLTTINRMLADQHIRGRDMASIFEVEVTVERLTLDEAAPSHT